MPLWTSINPDTVKSHLFGSFGPSKRCVECNLTTAHASGVIREPRCSDSLIGMLQMLLHQRCNAGHDMAMGTFTEWHKEPFDDDTEDVYLS